MIPPQQSEPTRQPFECEICHKRWCGGQCEREKEAA